MANWWDEDEEKVQPRSIWERFKDEYLDAAASNWLGAGGIVRGVGALKGEGKQTKEAIVRLRREKAEARARDEEAFEDYDTLSPANIGKNIVDLTANILGGVDPTYVLAPGKTAVQKIIGQGTVNAGADVVNQGASIAAGEQKKYSPRQTAVNAAAGVAFQGMSEAAALAKQFGRVTSIKRSPAKNKAVGGVKNSYHLTGRAIDIARGKGVSHQDIVAEYKRRGYKIVEALDEGDHTHIAFDFKGGRKAPVQGPDKLEPVRMTEDQATPEQMAMVNDRLSPVDELEDLMPRVANEDNVVDFNQMRQEKITKDLYEHLTGNKAPDNLSMEDMVGASRNPFKEDDVEGRLQHLTPAERQEMDATINPLPPVDNYHEKFTPYQETPRADNDLARPAKQYTDAEWARLPNETKQSALSLQSKLDTRLDSPLKKPQDALPSPAAVKKAQELGVKSLDDLTPHQWAELEEAIKDGQADKPNFFKSFKNMLDDDSGSYRMDDPSDARPELAPVIRKVIDRLAEAKPVRKAQERAYSKARAERFEEAGKVPNFMEGRAAFYAMKGRLKGDLPKIDYESIRQNFSDEEETELFNLILKDPHLSTTDKITAGEGLDKLLGVEGSTVPTKGELAMLSRIFTEELVDALAKNRGWKDKLSDVMREVFAAPRAVMATGDLSAPLRQGVFFVGRKEFYSAFKDMFGQFANKETFAASQAEISRRPTHGLMRENGLALTNVGKFIDEREEQFTSHLVSKIPVFGKVTEMSEQAYVGFLNRLRADVFDDFVRKAEDLGIDIKAEPKYLKDAARFINAATGRGSLGDMSQAARVLSQTFFSPRLIASRLQLLNPFFYGRLHPSVRKEALKSAGSFGGIAASILGLAAMGGATVSMDLLSSDFGKMKFGDTRYDILGGFQQYIVAGARIASGMKTTNKGETVELGKKYGQDTRKDVLFNLFENKTAPIPSFMIAWMDGREKSGEKFDAKQAAIQRAWPILWQDITEMTGKYGPVGGLMVLPAFFGVGVQDYGKDDIKEKNKAAKAETTKETTKDWWSDDDSSDSSATPVTAEGNWWDE